MAGVVAELAGADEYAAASGAAELPGPEGLLEGLADSAVDDSLGRLGCFDGLVNAVAHGGGNVLAGRLAVHCASPSIS